MIPVWPNGIVAAAGVLSLIDSNGCFRESTGVRLRSSCSLCALVEPILTFIFAKVIGEVLKNPRLELLKRMNLSLGIFTGNQAMCRSPVPSALYQPLTSDKSLLVIRREYPSKHTLFLEIFVDSSKP